jgi:hypothetical protein
MAKKIRIAVSVVCMIACVMVLVLWARSYRWADSLSVGFDGRSAYWGLSIDGELRFGMPDSRAHPLTWKMRRPSAYREGEGRVRSFVGFGWARAAPNEISGPIVPHWFVAGALLALAACPWMRWQFNLRVLVAVMTLVAGLLVLIALLRR